MMMTGYSLDLDELEDITPATWPNHDCEGEYRPYEPDENGVPPFLPVGNTKHQVRLNASTHDETGLIRATPAALDNTRRLRTKIERAVDRFNRYSIDEDKDAATLIVTYGVTAGAAREAVASLRNRGERAALLVLESMIPIPADVGGILDRYTDVIVVEENEDGLLAEMLYGRHRKSHVRRVNKIGSLIHPDEIIDEVDRCQKVS
jgi:2-oxoglutarate ferredoxin oxidoreductase subunit alpha